MLDTHRFASRPICIVGNINRDVKVQGVPSSTALFEDGETSVPPIIETIGGGGANSACAAAALGAGVRFFGKVGADALGERLRATLERFGVKAHLACDSRWPTGTTVALGWNTGQRHFLSCLPNNEALTFEDLDLTALNGCEHLLRADIWFSKPMLEGGNLRLLTAAHKLGIVTSLDINFDPCWSTGSKPEVARRKTLVRDILSHVDLAHGNVRELCEFSDSSELETALHRLADWGVKAVVVHLGERGAGYWTAGRLLVEPPCPAQKAVNCTGTGDILSLCMIVLHVRTDLSIQEKLRLANRVVAQYIEGRRSMIPAL